MDEFQYPPLKSEDIDKFIYQVQNKSIDTIEYMKILEGFIYQFVKELNPPLDYISEREYELILILQNQLTDKDFLVQIKILIVNVLCNIFTLSPFATEYFCENGGINQLNQLCAHILQTEYDKTNFRRLSDIVLACIGICIEYQPEQSLISLQTNTWIYNLFNIYQKPSQYRSLANYISLLITNSPSDQSRLIIPQISSIFVNLLNFYDSVIYAFILKSLKNIKDKETLILLAQQNIITVLCNYLVTIQAIRPRDRSLILQFLYVLSTHCEALWYFSQAKFCQNYLMQFTFISQSSYVVVPRYSLQVNKKDDDSNSIVLLIGIVTNLIRQEFNQNFFQAIALITNMHIRNITVIDSILNLIATLQYYRSLTDCDHIYLYLKQTLLSLPQTKVYLENNTKLKHNLLQIMNNLAQFQSNNPEFLQILNEVSNIQTFQLPNSQNEGEEDVENLAEILANMDLTEK